MKRNKKTSEMLSKLEDIKNYFEEMQQEKQSSFDNKSERWQDSDKGMDAQSDIDAIESFVENLQNCLDESESLFEIED